MIDAYYVLIPEALGERADAWGGWGYLDLRFSNPEKLCIIAGFSDRGATRLANTDDSFLRTHFTRHHEVKTNSGLWYRVDQQLHALWFECIIRRCAVSPSVIQEHVQPSAWVQPPRDELRLVVTLSGQGSERRWSTWWLRQSEAWPAHFDVVTAGYDPFSALGDAWPTDDLAGCTGTVVGCGSIGGYAASSLAAAGLGNLQLVDPDRLQQRNVARHVLELNDVGRYKVNALRDHLQERHGDLSVHAFPSDVERDADLMRPLFAASDVIVVCTDGVLSRRVANHLARRAVKPVVFAAVLEDGGLGEVVRVRPQDGCLLCLRRDLVEREVMDPERGLDAGYGNGSAHRPMTAAPGDLRLMGELASKAAIATLLERRGRWEHRLPTGWQLIGLQPKSGLPAPFDIERAGAVHWEPLPAARVDCPTCGPR